MKSDDDALLTFLLAAVAKVNVHRLSAESISRWLSKLIIGFTDLIFRVFLADGC